MNIKKIYFSTPFKIGELLIFFGLAPYLTGIYVEGWQKVIPLIIIAVFFLLLLQRFTNFNNAIFFRFDSAYFKKSLPRMVFITLVIIFFTGWIFPDLLFEYPAENLKKYLITFVFYPLASVVPQEFIYRVYFFERYKKLIPSKYLLMFVNALIFGLTHLIYDNWIAPIATFMAAWIFIINYFNSKSFLNVCLEHYYYGFVIFTVGLEHFFT
ncbi:MAG TPA: CPBP family glutamic-type intramembrane protease [Salegentibacter sp.]|uniref:CPBP family glutamic-type intramembrane protease n=1 Tax=Salegentibacter sp. TaxID=1903072 RepID=UPI002F947637